MLRDLANAVWAGAYGIAFASVICTVLELLQPGERQSWWSRARGLCFWAVYLLTGTVALFFVQRLLARAGLTPLLRIDLTQTVNSSNWLVMALGYTLLPFAGLFVFDFFYYWFHRAQHAVTGLWRLHSVHHSLEELNAFNNYHHATEELLRVPLIVVPIALLIQVDAPHVAVQLFILRIAGQLIHANTGLRYGPLRYMWSEPRYHRIHHSLEPRHWNKNFAAFFPLWDVLFGTAYFPVRGEYPRTGLADMREPHDLKSYLFPAKATRL